MLRTAIATYLVLAAVWTGGPGVTGVCQAESPTWPSWRGGVKQGVLPDGEYPTHWNADTNEGILWRTPIPGQGFSSPVVDGQQIFLTTASLSEYVSVGRMVNHWSLLAAAFACCAFGCSFVVQHLGQNKGSGKTELLSWLRALAVLLALGLLLTFVLYGESLGERGDSRTRGWIVQATVALLAMVAGAAVLPPKSMVHRVATVLVLVLAALLWVWSPIKSESNRLEVGNELTVKMAVVLFVGMGTLAAGCWNLIARAMVAGSQNQSPTQPAAWWKRVIPVLSVLAVLGGGGLIGLVVKRFIGPDFELGRLNFQSAYPMWATIALIATALAALIAGCLANGISCTVARYGLSAAAIACGVLLFAQFNWTPTQRKSARSIVCLDRNSGRIVWQREGLYEEVKHIDPHNSLATPTAAVDGEHIVAYFGTAGLFCTDPQGRVLWTRTDLRYDSLYGVGSSPLLVQDTVVIQADSPAEFSTDGTGRLWAIDVRTGQTQWQAEWPASRSFSGNSRTPCAIAYPQGTAIVVWGWGWLRGYDVASGAELWNVPVPQPMVDQVVGPVMDDRHLVLTDMGGTRVWDREALIQGQIDELWGDRRTKANCPSPCLVGGRLYTVTDAGVAACLDAKSGRTLWRQRLDGNYFASVAGTAQHVYFTNTDGLTTIVETGRTFKMVAQCPSGQRIMASIAPCENRLLIRSEHELICIGAR